MTAPDVASTAATLTASVVVPTAALAADEREDLSRVPWRAE